MASCEKCWSDAYFESRVSGKGQSDCYTELVQERKDNPCTPEQQAGMDAEECQKCERKTIHQIIGVCVVCSFNNRV